MKELSIVVHKNGMDIELTAEDIKSIREQQARNNRIQLLNDEFEEYKDFVVYDFLRAHEDEIFASVNADTTIPDIFHKYGIKYFCPNTIKRIPNIEARIAFLEGFKNSEEAHAIKMILEDCSPYSEFETLFASSKYDISFNDDTFVLRGANGVSWYNPDEGFNIDDDIYLMMNDLIECKSQISEYSQLRNN